MPFWLDLDAYNWFAIFSLFIVVTFKSWLIKFVVLSTFPRGNRSLVNLH